MCLAINFLKRSHTNIICNLRDTLLLVQCPGLLACRVERVLDLTGNCLIGTQGFLSEGLIDRIKIGQKALRNALIVWKNRLIWESWKKDEITYYLCRWLAARYHRLTCSLWQGILQQLKENVKKSTTIWKLHFVSLPARGLSSWPIGCSLWWKSSSACTVVEVTSRVAPSRVPPFNFTIFSNCPFPMMSRLTIKAVLAALDFAKAIVAVCFSELKSIDSMLSAKRSSFFFWRVRISAYCPQNLDVKSLQMKWRNKIR